MNQGEEALSRQLYGLEKGDWYQILKKVKKSWKTNIVVVCNFEINP